jgi:hypothetical protein
LGTGLALGQALEDLGDTGLMCLVELLLLEIIGDQGLQGSGQGGDGPVTRTRLGLGLKLGLERADLLLHLGYSLDIRA